VTTALVGVLTGSMCGVDELLEEQKQIHTAVRTLEYDDDVETNKRADTDYDKRQCNEQRHEVDYNKRITRSRDTTWVAERQFVAWTYITTKNYRQEKETDA